MKRMIILIALLGLTACGQNDSNPGAETSTVFSTWENEDGNIFDLTNGQLTNPFEMAFITQDGAICRCETTLIGIESEGTLTYGNCEYQAGSGAANPGCEAINRVGTYEVKGSTLNVCGEDTDGSNSRCGTFTLN